jgi:transcriptional regulator with XRE-family HTH domain
MEENFVEWLIVELRKRGWSNSELARRSGLAHSTISMVINGQSNPGWDFGAQVADALGLPTSRVHRIMKLGKSPPSGQKDITLLELIDLMELLPESERLEILRYAIYRKQSHDGEKYIAGSSLSGESASENG